MKFPYKPTPSAGGNAMKEILITLIAAAAYYVLAAKYIAGLFIA